MKKIQQLISMKGRLAIITGAAGYIGTAISEALAEVGADLILLDRDEESLKNLCDKLEEEYSINAEHLVVDLENENEVRLVPDYIEKNYGKIDVLVNNAAFVGSSADKGWNEVFEKQSIDIWRRALEVNLTSAFYLAQSCSKYLKKGISPTIINIGSIYGVNGPDPSLYEGTHLNNPAAYAVSKGGLIQMTKWLSTILAPEIRVNAISPGGVFRGQPDKFCEQYNKRTPLGRMANEEDFKGSIVFFASDMSKYVTGQNLMVDGGWGVW